MPRPDNPKLQKFLQMFLNNSSLLMCEWVRMLRNRGSSDICFVKYANNTAEVATGYVKQIEIFVDKLATSLVDARFDHQPKIGLLIWF